MAYDRKENKNNGNEPKSDIQKDIGRKMAVDAARSKFGPVGGKLADDFLKTKLGDKMLDKAMNPPLLTSPLTRGIGKAARDPLNRLADKAKNEENKKADRDHYQPDSSNNLQNNDSNKENPNYKKDKPETKNKQEVARKQAALNQQNQEQQHEEEKKKKKKKKKKQNIALKIKIGLILAGIIAFVFVIMMFAALFTELVSELGLGGGGGSGRVTYESECNFENTTVTVYDLYKQNILDTVNLEDYIIGTACIEIGACDGAIESMNEHYIKSQYVSSKTYVLERSRYNSATKELTIRASTADQGYCSLTKGCYQSRASLGGYTFEVFYPGGYGGVPAKRKFTEKDLELAHKYYQETMGELFIESGYSQPITNLPIGGATTMAYKSTTQNFWSWAANKGHTYDEILRATANPTSLGYGSFVADRSSYSGKDIYRLGDYCHATSSFGSDVDYPLNGGNTPSLNKPITQALSSSEIQTINDNIMGNVDSAGYGTGDAVAAAATTLIYEMYKLGYHLPYWYGGGHAPGLTIGVDNKWGQTGGSIDPSYYNWNATRQRYTYSYDCSGFVSWAIKNGCSSGFGGGATGLYLGMNTRSLSSFDGAAPGDVLVNSGHIILIVKVNDDGSVITAESCGSGGIIFRHVTSKPANYQLRSMGSWYNTNCKSSR